MFELKPAVWIIAGLVLAALEMLIPGLVIIWFGVAAVVSGILAIFVHNPYIQFGVFIVLSAVSGGAWEWSRRATNWQHPGSKELSAPRQSAQGLDARPCFAGREEFLS